MKKILHKLTYAQNHSQNEAYPSYYEEILCKVLQCYPRFRVVIFLWTDVWGHCCKNQIISASASPAANAPPFLLNSPLCRAMAAAAVGYPGWSGATTDRFLVLCWLRCFVSEAEGKGNLDRSGSPRLARGWVLACYPLRSPPFLRTKISRIVAYWTISR